MNYFSKERDQRLGNAKALIFAPERLGQDWPGGVFDLDHDVAFLVNSTNAVFGGCFEHARDQTADPGESKGFLSERLVLHLQGKDATTRTVYALLTENSTKPFFGFVHPGHLETLEPVFVSGKHPDVLYSTNHDKALALISAWETEKSAQDKKDWEDIRKGLKEHRLSNRRLFND